MSISFVQSLIFGLIFMYGIQFALAFLGWRTGQSLATDRGLWRIFWENARFRDLVTVLRIAGLVGLGALAASNISSPDGYGFFVGLLIAFFFRTPADLPVMLMVRWNIRPPDRSAKTPTGTPKRTTRSRGSNGQDPF